MIRHLFIQRIPTQKVLLYAIMTGLISLLLLKEYMECFIQVRSISNKDAHAVKLP